MKPLHGAILVLATLAVLCLVRVRTFTDDLSSRSSSLSNDDYASRQFGGSGHNANNTVSGSGFTGERIRSFSGHRKFAGRNDNRLKTLLCGDGANYYRFPVFEGLASCTSWAVVTTVNVPTEAVKVAAQLPSDAWCLLIVGDEKTPENYIEQLRQGSDENTENGNKKRIIFLSASDQRRLYQNHPFVKRLPFHSFARKNLGFLFAIQHGAQLIFDFDDENILYSLPIVPNGTVNSIEPYRWRDREDTQISNHIFVRYFTLENDDQVAPFAGQVLNPYPFLKPVNSGGKPIQDVWPRGYPLEQLSRAKNFVHSHDGHLSANSPILIRHGRFDTKNIGVIPYTCNGNPDVDSVYRLTRELPLNFDRDPVTAQKLLIPPQSYAPYNAQATVHFYQAFFSLLLPLTVPESVADIWRAYFAQRLFHDLGLAVVYAPPVVHRALNSLKHGADMQAEAVLYQKTEKLIAFLEHKWTWASNDQQDVNYTLLARWEDMWISLYERDFIGLADVEIMQEWLLTLLAVGYKFPTVLDATFANDSFRIRHVEPVPTFKGQPYWKGSIPLHLGGPSGQETYYTFLQRRGVATEKLWQEWLRGVENKQHAVSPSKKVVRLIMMTMNEWPLIVRWTIYHGALLGYENLYIMDSSTDKWCIEFLVYARDQWGVNIIFTNADLNNILSEINVIATSFAPFSDFVTKADTDEFLASRNHNANSSCFASTSNLRTLPSCELTPYQVQDYLNGLVPTPGGGRMRFGLMSSSRFDRELCEAGKGNELGEYKFSPPMMIPVYKAILDARTFSGFDLGGHMGERLSGYHNQLPDTFTELGMLHLHSRCIEQEVENNRKALVRHKFIAENDSPAVSLQKLLRKCSKTNPCQENFSCTGVSSHKVKNYVTYLSCPKYFIAMRYDSVEPNVKVNPDFQQFLGDAMRKYGGFHFLRAAQTRGT